MLYLFTSMRNHTEYLGRKVAVSGGMGGLGATIATYLSRMGARVTVWHDTAGMGFSDPICLRDSEAVTIVQGLPGSTPEFLDRAVHAAGGSGPAKGFDLHFDFSPAAALESDCSLSCQPAHPHDMRLPEFPDSDHPLVKCYVSSSTGTAEFLLPLPYGPRHSFGDATYGPHCVSFGFRAPLPNMAAREAFALLRSDPELFGASPPVGAASPSGSLQGMDDTLDRSRRALGSPRFPEGSTNADLVRGFMDLMARQGGRRRMGGDPLGFLVSAAMEGAMGKLDPDTLGFLRGFDAMAGPFGYDADLALHIAEAGLTGPSGVHDLTAWEPGPSGLTDFIDASVRGVLRSLAPISPGIFLKGGLKTLAGGLCENLARSLVKALARDQAGLMSGNPGSAGGRMPSGRSSGRIILGSRQTGHTGHSRNRGLDLQEGVGRCFAWLVRNAVLETPAPA